MCVFVCVRVCVCVVCKHVCGSDPEGNVCVYDVFKERVMTHSLFLSEFTLELGLRRLSTVSVV